MNANGALLACYGKNKMNRIPFTPDQIRKMKCSAEIREEQWNVNLTLPIEILEQVYGKLNLQEGSDFRCNFYKICETKGIRTLCSVQMRRKRTAEFSSAGVF